LRVETFDAPHNDGVLIAGSGEDAIAEKGNAVMVRCILSVCTWSGRIPVDQVAVHSPRRKMGIVNDDRNLHVLI
jgi:hypothetical protein